MSDDVCNPRCTLSNCDFLEIFLFWFFVEDDFDLAEVSLLSAAPSFGMIADTSVPFGFADDAAMDPESEYVKALVLGVVKEIVECSHK